MINIAQKWGRLGINLTIFIPKKGLVFVVKFFQKKHAF